MASRVGCGTNSCWLKSLLLIELISTFIAIIGLFILIRYFTVVGQRYDGNTWVAIIGCFFGIGLCFIHAWFLALPLREEQNAGSPIVDHTKWRHFSIYTMVIMGITAIAGILLLIIYLIVLVNPRQGNSSDGSFRVSIDRVVSLLVYRGILLLLAKNRYEERLKHGDAAAMAVL